MGRIERVDFLADDRFAVRLRGDDLGVAFDGGHAERRIADRIARQVVRARRC